MEHLQKTEPMSAIDAGQLEGCLTTGTSIEAVLNDFEEAIDAPESAVSPFIELVQGMVHQLDETAQDAAQARERAREAEARADNLEQEVVDLEQEVVDLEQEVVDLEQEVVDLEQEVADLEQELADQADRQARETANNRKRISELEEREAEDSDDNPHPKGGENPPADPETSLEQVCALDDKTASRQLTSNQQRARFVAKNPTDYFSKVPAGYSLTSGEIGKVLRAGTDCDGHTATVDRVIGFLNKFGESDVEVVKRRGTRRVIFSEEIVERLTRLSSRGCDAAEKGEV